VGVQKRPPRFHKSQQCAQREAPRQCPVQSSWSGWCCTQGKLSADYCSSSSLTIFRSWAMLLATMRAIMVRCWRSLLDSTMCDLKRSSVARTQDQVSLLVLLCLCILTVCSCLAHVINLGTQVLIGTYSKAPHYTPHSPQAHEPDSTQRGDHDEIGLVQAICVKVCLRSFSSWALLNTTKGTLICETKRTL